MATLVGRIAEKVELDQFHKYKTFLDLGKGVPVPEGFKKIPCHIVYDFKCSDSRKKARFVAGGHRTNTPIGSTYSGVVSLPGIRIVTAVAKLNELGNLGHQYQKCLPGVKDL